MMRPGHRVGIRLATRCLSSAASAGSTGSTGMLTHGLHKVLQGAGPWLLDDEAVLAENT